MKFANEGSFSNYIRCPSCQKLYRADNSPNPIDCECLCSFEWFEPEEMLDQTRPLDSMIGRLDRLLSEFLVVAESELDEPDRHTMKHHADDLIGVGNAALKRLAKEKT